MEPMHTLKPEDNVLLILARPSLDDNHSELIERYIGSKFDWGYFLKQAMHQKTIPFCRYHLLNPDFPFKQAVPLSIKQQLVIGHESIIQINTLMLKELRRILEVMDKNKINVLSLKGPVLGHQLYQDISLKTASDIDLLAHPEQVHETIAALYGADYSQSLYDLLKKDRFQPPKAYTFHWHYRDPNNHLFPFTRTPQMFGPVHEVVSQLLSEYESYLMSNPLAKEYELTHSQRSQIWNMCMSRLYKTPYLTILDLHYHICYPSEPLVVDLKEWFDTATTCQVSGDCAIPVFNIVNQLIYLSRHLFFEATFYRRILKNEEVKLDKFQDVFQIIKLHDSPAFRRALVKRANELKAIEPVYYTLFYLDRLYDSSSINDILGRFDRPRRSLPDEFYGEHNGTTTFFWDTPFLDRLFNKNSAKAATEVVKKATSSEPGIRCFKIQSSMQDDLGFLDPDVSDPQIRIPESFNESGHRSETHLQVGEIPKSNSDLSAKCWIGWNESFFYLAVHVIDDFVIPGQSCMRGFLYDQDAVRIYFQGQSGIQSLFIVLKPDHQDGAVCLTQDIIHEVLFASKITESSRVLASKSSSGYQISARIPWAAVDLNPRVGDTIYFDIELYDCDNRLDGVKTVLAWSGRERRNEYDISVLVSRP